MTPVFELGNIFGGNPSRFHNGWDWDFHLQQVLGDFQVAQVFSFFDSHCFPFFDSHCFPFFKSHCFSFRKAFCFSLCLPFRIFNPLCGLDGVENIAVGVNAVFIFFEVLCVESGNLRLFEEFCEDALLQGGGAFHQS